MVGGGVIRPGEDWGAPTEQPAETEPTENPASPVTTEQTEPTADHS